MKEVGTEEREEGIRGLRKEGRSEQENRRSLEWTIMDREN